MSKTIRRGKASKSENPEGNVPAQGTLAHGKYERALLEMRVVRYTTVGGYTLWYAITTVSLATHRLCNHCAAVTDYVYMDAEDRLATDEQLEAFRCSCCGCSIDEFGSRRLSTLDRRPP